MHERQPKQKQDSPQGKRRTTEANTVFNPDFALDWRGSGPLQLYPRLPAYQSDFHFQCRRIFVTRSFSPSSEAQSLCPSIFYTILVTDFTDKSIPIAESGFNRGTDCCFGLHNKDCIGFSSVALRLPCGENWIFSSS
jgi:hypothetical protein